MDAIKSHLKTAQQSLGKAPPREEVMALSKVLAEAIQKQGQARVNFICTHNSRRSQLAQVWCQLGAWTLGLPIKTYSGGTVATQLYSSVVTTLVNEGIDIKGSPEGNVPIRLYFGDDMLDLFSKEYSDGVNPKADFIAVMTCDHADENCPIVTGATNRTPLTYEDPKKYDGTPKETEAYKETSEAIALDVLQAFRSIYTYLHHR